MRSSTFVSLFLFAAANAAPFVLNGRTVNSTKWTPDHVLKPYEVILYGEDRMEVVHEDVYHEMVKSMGVMSHAPDHDDHDFHNLPWNGTVSTNSTKPGKIDARGCETTYSIVADKTFDFIDWDVQMSPVVTAGITSMDINVMKGYTVTNSVQVSAGLDITWIKDKLKNTVGINYSRQWATQTTVNIKGTVSPGYSGCMITKPYKTRRTGRAFTGCPGSIKETGTWQADSFKEGSYDGISWVSGSITICQKQGSIPLSRCSGSGNFI
ncbi:hypothetical protein CkaCkLH20_03784 [Colletotrichum karsti]|uniref:Uncharacterized protein n=1 Tax=Colletotrichum karsti TaxID=1095194 RepID=A0A9P6I9U4_9PEZI|nr:uncharacterized protein CkaCkLH20_03784 [Colletotrichum karsti]KAF9878884.1 hypothetical protein CkaCkLH20_03784 [Colletotrichum karsti]